MHVLKHRIVLLSTMLALALSPALLQAAESPAAPATQPATRPASAPTSGPIRVSLNFKDAPLDTVLNFLSQNLGFEILKDGPVDGRVTLLSKQAVSAEEAVAMLNAALKINGFTVVREGQLLRINARDKAKKGNLPVHFGNDPSEVANTDELITQVIPIQNVSATKLRDDLKPLIGPDADVTANEGSNAIIITDASSSIRRIVQIISELDQHEAMTSEIRIVQLRHATASATSKLIDGFFKPSAAPAQQQNDRMMQQQGGPPQGGGGHTGPERHGQTVITAADDRTNTLLVMASTATLKVIDDIIKQIDSDAPNPVPPAELRAFPLKFAEADATAKIINNIFKAPKENDFPFLILRFGGGDEQKKEGVVNAVADDRTNTLLVTAPTEKMKAVADMLQQLDSSPMVSGDLRVIHLKHADAYSVSKLVEEMFNPKPQGDSTPRSPYYYLFNEGATPQPKARDAKITVTADDRTNSLLVSAPTALLDVVEKVVHDLDADATTEDTMFIYHLRNGQASHMEYVLNVLFGNISSPQNNQQQGQQQQQNQQQQQGQNGMDPGFGRVTQASNSTNNRSSSNNRSNNRANQSGARGVSPSIAQAANELTGKVLVVADIDTNALLVTTASKYEQQVRRIIADLDKPVPQVLIKVLIAEVSHDNNSDLGLDFSVLNIGANGKGTKGGAAFGNASAGAANGGLVVSMLESNVTATLHALATAGKLDVLSRPYILASDNQLATITVGEIVPFVTESRLDLNNNTINTVQYRDIGIILDVTPHINPDGLVILDVSPQISSMTQTTIQLSPGVNSPVFQQRSANSRVGIMDGQTIVIGGLMQDQKTATLQKIPVLGDIPLLGLLFQRNQVQKTKTELLIFLTPHVAQQADGLPAMSVDETKGTRLTPNAVEPGTFQDHLRGMERGHIPQSQPAAPMSPVNSIDLSEPAEKAPTNSSDSGAPVQALPR